MFNARAYACTSPTAALAGTTIPRRDPTDRDVRIDILFCGICHSDLHTARDEWKAVMPTTYPCVPGHEIVGRVTQVGRGVTRFKVGDVVGVGCLVGSDHTCPNCKTSLEQFCPNGTFTYNSPDRHGTAPVAYGGYSDSIVVEEDMVLRIPPNLDLAGAAPLLCAGITTYSPLKRNGVGPGKKVGVVGLGGLGHMGVKLAHAMGAHVAVFTTSPDKKEDARRLGADEVVLSKNAVSRGVNFLNWSGFAEGPPDDGAFPAAVAALNRERDRVAVCVQFAARTAGEAAGELRAVLAALRSDYVDVLTLYYVERADEWAALAAPGGAVEYLRAAKADGVVRRLGVTSHQRPLAAAMAASGLLDCVMVRYNAAHRGAERDVFPAAAARGLPVIAYTALRRGALRRPTPADPPGFVPPPAPAWYRFALQQPAVSVVLSAPHTRAELDQDLEVLSAPGPLPADQYDALARHGERVRAHAGRFA